jgi:hypothetical protein
MFFVFSGNVRFAIGKCGEFVFENKMAFLQSYG